VSVSRLRHIPGIGVDEIGDAADADAANDPDLLRLENLDTDLRPPRVALEVTKAAVDDDAANSYLPFQGHRALRAAAAAHVGRLAGRHYDQDTEAVGVAGGLNGVLNTLLAVVEPGQEVVIADPIYAGLSTGSVCPAGCPGTCPPPRRPPDGSPTRSGWPTRSGRTPPRSWS
jgi:aspartate/methionine/tyrosine aminotransferase